MPKITGMEVNRMKLDEVLEKIEPADLRSREQASEHWKTVGKPLNSLGKLEDAVTRIAGMRRTKDYTLKKKGLVIMCADNGVVAEGVTQDRVRRSQRL